MTPDIPVETYKTGKLPTWCPGCGDFGIWMSLKNALSKLGIGSDDALLIYGIGCHGNMYDWMRVYGLSGLHGRGVAIAQGAKMANHKLPVICISGDGDCLGEGGNHFIHAAKRNPDITVIIYDNQLYSLTTGQASPTANTGFKTKSTPLGVIDTPINPLTLAITTGATFVSRGFSGDTPGLTQLFIDAIKHKGFSLVDTIQPCVTYDKIHTYQWFRQRITALENDYTPDNRMKAMEKALLWGDKIYTGVFYKEEKPTSEDGETALTDTPLVEQPLGVPDMDTLLSEFI